MNTLIKAIPYDYSERKPEALLEYKWQSLDFVRTRKVSVTW